MALMVASVPELTIRTISTEGTASTTILARVISSSVGAPKLLPLPTAYPWSILFRILGIFGLNEMAICENEKYLIILLQLDCKYDLIVLVS
jgi:hypothetical protein